MRPASNVETCAICECPSQIPAQIPAGAWADMEAEAYAAGRCDALGHPVAAIVGAERYYDLALPQWGELLAEVSSATMELVAAHMRCAYLAGYAEVHGEAYAAGYAVGLLQGEVDPLAYWRGAVQREGEQTGRQQGLWSQIYEPYYQGHRAGRAASRV